MAATRKTPGKRRVRSPDAAAAKKLRPTTKPASVVDVARQLRAWTDSVLGIAGAAADATVAATKMLLPNPGSRAALERTGAVLRRMREAAGLSIGEVAAAIDLSDPDLLQLVENGKVALPFEIILRLASVLGRNDPISFVMRFTRSYNPEIWKTLERLGVGRLALQAGREREFANIYRGNDAARDLSDEDFNSALNFARTAFDMAVAFRRDQHAGKRSNGGD